MMSLIAYAPRIGFYTDDWAFLSHFKACSSQSFSGLFGCLYSAAPNTQTRPVQILLLTAIYKFAGVHPIGSQACIALLLVAAVLAFYMVLRELRVPRLLAVSLPLVYGLLPHYSTDRFWMASSQSLVSAFFGFLCFYFALRAASASRRTRWRWQSGCMFALVVSALAYEIFIPLFVLVPFLYWYATGRRPRESTPTGRGFRRRANLFWIGTLFLLITVSAYKFVAILGNLHLRFLHRLLQVMAQGMVRTINFNYSYYGLGLPAVAWNAVRFYPNAEALILAVIVACATVAYFLQIIRSSESCFPRTLIWIKILGLGLVIYGLGYSLFFAYTTLNLTSADPKNRITLAAAIGAAISIVGLLGLASRLARSNRHRMKVFAILVTIYAVSEFLIVNAIGCFWVAASRKQDAVIASVRRSFPVFPAKSVLILDGVCPSVGPAPVFEFDYDLGDALMIEYGNPDVRADVVSPAMKVGQNGLTSETFGHVNHYAYGSNLIVFNAKQKEIERLTSAKVALQYFKSHDPDLNGNCRPARWSPSIYPFKKSGMVRIDCSDGGGAR